MSMMPSPLEGLEPQEVLTIHTALDTLARQCNSELMGCRTAAALARATKNRKVLSRIDNIRHRLVAHMVRLHW